MRFVLFVLFTLATLFTLPITVDAKVYWIGRNIDMSPNDGTDVKNHKMIKGMGHFFAGISKKNLTGTL